MGKQTRHLMARAARALAQGAIGCLGAAALAQISPPWKGNPPEGWERVEVRYGERPQNVMDIYKPSLEGKEPRAALLFAHGGGWRRGSKSSESSVERKMRSLTSRGVVFVSMDYDLKAPPSEQARQVGKAFETLRKNAKAWGIDERKLSVAGHSAGAHLVALALAQGELDRARAALILDAAALDAQSELRESQGKAYGGVFGSDPSAWGPSSPASELEKRPRDWTPIPALLVCSEPAGSCRQHQAFQERLIRRGGVASLIKAPLSHYRINDGLGEEQPYTQQVWAFLERQGAMAPQRP